MKSPALIVLHPSDNVATALRDIPANAPASVTGADGALLNVAPSVAIRLGHKLALRAIPAGALVLKHGVPIGRANAAIAAGDHVHVHNVVSLSRETDLVPSDSQGA